MRILLFLAALLPGLMPGSGWATAKPAVEIHRDGWWLTELADKCALWTMYSEKDRPIELVLFYLPESDQYTFMLKSQRYARTLVGRQFRMSVRFDDTQAKVMVSGVTSATGVGLAGRVDADFLETFANARTLEVDLEGAWLGRFKIDEPRELTAEFVRCSAEAWKAQFDKRQGR